MVVPLRSPALEIPLTVIPAVRIAASEPTYVETVITLWGVGKEWEIKLSIGIVHWKQVHWKKPLCRCA